MALLFGALLIVTGPTVIAPLLRNVKPTAHISGVLKWDGILIDPIGALVAYIVFEALLAKVQPSFLAVAVLCGIAPLRRMRARCAEMHSFARIGHIPISW